MTLTAAELRTHLVDLRRQTPEARFFAFHATAPWEGPEQFRIDDDQFRVVQVRSPLEMREHMQRAGNGPIVFLTAQTDADLGDDLRSRLARQRVVRPREWDTVRRLFAAREVDPRLRRLDWIARALLENEPAGGYPKSVTGVLGYGEAWEALTAAVFGALVTELEPLLQWCAAGEGHRGFLTLSPPARAGITQATPLPDRVLLRLVAADEGSLAVPLGLVCGVLFHPDPEGAADRAVAAGRLERYLQGERLDAGAGRAWARAAQALLTARPNEGPGWLEAADRLLQSVGATEHAHLSDVLASGLDARFGELASALTRWTDQRGGDARAAVEERARRVAAHWFAERDRAEAAAMAARLVRWLDTDEVTPGDLAAAARLQRDGGGHADWALTALDRVEPHGALSEAYRAVAALGRERRERESRAFATLLRDAGSQPPQSGDLVAVEQVLERVAGPVAAVVPMLVVVLDGMSAAVLAELIEDVRRQGWRPVEPARGPLPLALATVPSLTTYSRASLLCGHLTKGDQAVERAGFAAHSALRSASRTDRPPVLFHKAGIPGQALEADVAPLQEAIADPDRRVVGVVVNAIDDLLGKGDQVRPRWTTEFIRPLGWLLGAASAAGRGVVLLSDHGHILERGGEHRANSEGGHRWRPATEPPGDGEVEIAGPRVLAGHGRVVAPWTAELRYRPKAAGYHGGATHQEMLAPVAVLALEPLEGWEEAPVRRPPWWDLEPGLEAPAPKRRRAESAPADQGALFAAPEPLVAPTAPDWLARLLASAELDRQRRLAGRVSLDDALLQELLVVVDRTGVADLDTLSGRLDVGPGRVRTIVAAAQRLLNVEGYQVLALDPTGRELRLDRRLLEEQFGL